MTRPHPATVVAVVLIAVAVVGIANKTAGMSPFVWGLLIGAASSAFVSFRAGQYARGYAHARGIRRSHWNAIRGGHR